MSNEYKKINIGKIDRPVPPIRKHFDEQEMARLIQSIRDNGVAVPLLVRPIGDRFEVIDGDRRLNACWSAGVKEIPVVVKSLDDRETHIFRMLANLDREDTDPVSEAKYVAKLIHEKTFSAEEYAEKIGRSVSWVEDRMTIAEMPEYMQQALSVKSASLGLCLELNKITDENTKHRYFQEAVRNGMTIHAAKINRMQVNEAIHAVREQGKEVVKEELPQVIKVPEVLCALTGERLPMTATRMIRVGIENYNEFRKAIN